MVVTFDKDTEEILETFLNTDDPEKAKDISYDYADKLFFLKVHAEVNYNSSKDKYIAFLEQSPYVSRHVEYEEIGKFSDTYHIPAHNSYLSTDKEWEEHKAQTRSSKDHLKVEFDVAEEAQKFIDDQIDQLQKKLKGIKSKYEKASQYEREEYILTENSKAEHDTETIVVEENKSDKEESKSFWQRWFCQRGGMV